MDNQYPEPSIHDDANTMLESLLLLVDDAIAETRTAAEGLSQSVVEPMLRARLIKDLPGVSFTPADITAWAASISS